MLSVESMLLNLLRRHLFMGLTASALSTAPAAKGAIRYRQLWVSADGVTHIDEHECGKLETKDFMSRGADISFLSVYPGESETLFPPLTFLRPIAKETVALDGKEHLMVRCEPVIP